MENNIFNPTGNKEVDDFMNLITEIVALPDDALNADRVESIVGAMNGAVTEKQREEVIVELTKKMEQHPEEDVVKVFKETKEALLEELGSLSNEKQTLVSAIFDILVSFAEEAKDRAGNYATVVKFELCREGAKLPTYAHDTDAGCDIYAPEDITIPAGTLGFKVDTGLRMAMRPGWSLMIYPRSGLSMKTGLRISNSIGCVDCMYRNEISILFDNFAKEDYVIHAGDRIAQFVLEPVHQFKGEVVESVEGLYGDRNGGFGHSGK